MQNKFKHGEYLKWAAVAACAVLTLAFPSVFGSRGYYLAAFVFCVIAVGSVFASFENSGTDTLKLVLIAVMCALAVAGRMVFAAVPFVKPVAAFVIMSGAMLGPQRGFLTGAVTMLVSNFMFGQGPWTVWQMMAFGIIGFGAGLLFYRKTGRKTNISLALYGFIVYMLVAGPLLDISGIFAYTRPGKVSLVAVLLAGLPVNLTSAVSTVVFLLVLSKPVMSKLNRIIIKYGL